jgi:hypothetical protein
MTRISRVWMLLVLPLLLFLSCNQSSGDRANLQARIDDLQNQLDSVYVPGFGEIMNGIVQPHHYKLWLAGRHQNWTLAEYERHQLLGGFLRIQKYHKNTSEANALPMIYPEMEALKTAISQKDSLAFHQHFVLLTNTCNNCHRATKHEFNVIIVPATREYGNQQF